MDVEVPQIHIALIFKTDLLSVLIMVLRLLEHSLSSLAKGYSYSHKNGITKVKVIDKYGCTGWATQEEVKTHAIPSVCQWPC